MSNLSLKATVLISMGLMVVSSCLLTAFMATRLFSNSLEDSLTRHAADMTRSLSNLVTEMSLTNDVIGIQRIVDSQFDRNLANGYAFFESAGKIRTHSFDSEVPPAVAAWAPPAANSEESSVGLSSQVIFRRVVLPELGGYQEACYPLMEGHAGYLCMGFSQRDIQLRLNRLWMETAGLTAAILLLTLAAGIIWLRRTGRPLATLVQAIDSIGGGNLAIRVPVEGQPEVAMLAKAFNSMLERLEGSILSIESQSAALQRSHLQLRLCNDIVTVFAAIDRLEAMARQLLQYLHDIVSIPHSLILLEEDRRSVVVAHDSTYKIHHANEVWDCAQSLLMGQTGIFCLKGLNSPLVSDAVAKCDRQTVLCIMQNHVPCGALFLGHAEQGIDKADLSALELVLNQVTGSIGRALRTEKESRGLQEQEGMDSFCGMVGRSPAMRDVFQRVRAVATTDATILISGESGTGKELVARSLHSLSTRSKNPFIVINCAAYTESLLESELFGYEKGAFTGALRRKPGRFELADGGTVFLDEIGEISPMAQVRLLRVLQTRQFERVGGEQTLSVNVRILAATNRDLAVEVREGRFREDLYYRLDVISINMPALRDRPGDIPLLVKHYLASLNKRQEKSYTVSPAAMKLLMAYNWPGNVRELENLLENCATLNRHGEITPADLPERILDNVSVNASHTPNLSRKPLTLEDREALAIREALEQNAWSRKQAAARLGIGRTTLYAKMKRYGIHPPELHQ
jgi:Response regulator containing CheY-like receiver, AAA-type ATPase, and DNA-binding domains